MSDHLSYLNCFCALLEGFRNSGSVGFDCTSVGPLPRTFGPAWGFGSCERLDRVACLPITCFKMAHLNVWIVYCLIWISKYYLEAFAAALFDYFLFSADRWPPPIWWTSVDWSSDLPLPIPLSSAPCCPIKQPFDFWFASPASTSEIYPVHGMTFHLGLAARNFR